MEPIEGAIDPHTHYQFFSQLCPQENPDLPGSGDLYIICKPNASPRVINYTKLPFSSGKVHLFKKCTPNSTTSSGDISIKGIRYCEYSSYDFTKGPHCGHQYELAHKIDLILRCSQNRERSPYEGCYVTHQGWVIRDRTIVKLNLDDLELAYQKAKIRMEPLVCCMENLPLVAGIVLFFALSVFWIK